jgi:hypothetical protein
MLSTRYSSQVVIKLDFFYRFSKGKKILQRHVIKIRSVGVELFHAGRHDETNIRFLQFRERV